MPLDAIIILGGAGHAKVVIEIVRALGCYEIVGCLSATPRQVHVLDVPVLGNDGELTKLFDRGVRYAAVAIGDNATRLRLGKRLLSAGFAAPVLVHPSATVSPSATLGSGTVVMGGAVINARCSIGSFVIINTLAAIDHDCVLYDGVHIGPRSALAGDVQVGERAFMGIGSCAVPNSKIGEDSQVGAGGIVVTSIPPRVVAVGVPARVLRSRCDVL
jgi:UDP-perosamine 4-acetyltransferase